MQRRYIHLQPEDRLTIASLHQQGSSTRAIACVLGRSPSTICRELRRNRSADGYASEPAQRLCRQRRRLARPWPKLHPHGRLWLIVRTLLSWRWSPQQIAGEVAPESWTP